AYVLPGSDNLGNLQEVESTTNRTTVTSGDAISKASGLPSSEDLEKLLELEVLIDAAKFSNSTVPKADNIFPGDETLYTADSLTGEAQIRIESFPEQHLQNEEIELLEEELELLGEDNNSNGRAGHSNFTNSSEPLHQTEDLPFDIPDSVKRLQKDLLKEYTCLKESPFEEPGLQPLDQVESLSLQHYIAWRKTNGTVVAYNAHKYVLEKATGIEILSLYKGNIPIWTLAHIN
ncbi:hypothetical protein BDZ94DRAFT_1242299, partial [Collybia nuda]